METTSQEKKATVAEYELVLSYGYLFNTIRATTGIFVKQNENGKADFLIQDFFSQREIPTKTSHTVGGKIKCGYYLEGNAVSFQNLVRETVTQHLKEKIATDDSLSHIKTHGTMVEFHNWIIYDTNADRGAYWDKTEKIFEFKTDTGEIVKIKLWFEKSYYFRAEFMDKFPTVKFDYFTETEDLYKGIHSNTLKAAIKANLYYFDYFNGENAKKLFAEKICIIKGKILGENKACLDCIRKFINEHDHDPYNIIFSNYISQTAIDSFIEIVLRLREEKKSYKEVYLNSVHSNIYEKESL